MARKVRIELVLDAKGVVKGIKSIDGAVDDLDVSVKKTGKGLSTFKAALSAAFAAAVVRGVARFAARMFELGSAVEETGSKFNTVFGKMAERMDDFGESFANMAGLTKREFRDVASVTGSILQGLGADLATSASETQRVLTLAADLASFNNVSIQEAFAAIRSGLVGESEPLKRFGIVLTEAETKLRALNTTGKQSEKQLTNLEKAQARLNIIFANAGVAIGDLARTQTSAANEARLFNAVIREQEELLAEALLPALNDVRRAFSKAIIENKTFVQAGIALIGRWASETVRDVGQIIFILEKWAIAIGLINLETREARRQQQLLNMILSAHTTVVDQAAAADEEAARIAAEAAARIAAAAVALEAQNKGLVGITDTLNEEIRKLAFQVRDLTQADTAAVRVLFAKVLALERELFLRKQLLGLIGGPTEPEEVPVRPADVPAPSPDAALRILSERTAAHQAETEAIEDTEAAEKRLHEATIARAVALGAAQTDVLQAVLATVRQIIQARLAQAIAGAVAAGSILGPIAAAASGALMAILFNQLMPSGHKGSSGGAGSRARADTTSTTGAALGGIRVQRRGVTAGAQGAALSARAPLDLRIEVIEKDLFTINVLLKNADGVRDQVGSI